MWKDIRYACRIYRRNPTVVAVVVASIALSIGANTLIVSILYSLFLRPIPFLDVDRMALLSAQAGRGPWMGVSAPEFHDWTERQRVFAGIAAFRPGALNLSGGQTPERVKSASGSPGLFAALGARPALGRDFLAGEFEAGRNRVAIISHALWMRRFGADPGAIGRSIRLESETYLLVGVMPRGFTFPDQKTSVWTPLDLRGRSDRTERSLQVIARLRDGVTFDQVEGDMRRVTEGLDREHPDTNRDVRCVVRPLRDELVGNARASLAVLSCAVIFLFLVACLNVATLQYAANESRRTEIATRAALGATRPRLLRQFLTESLLLALAGGLGGIGLAHAGLDLLLRSVYLEIPSYVEFGINPVVLLFATAASVVTGLAVGIAPILDVSRSDHLRALKERSHALTTGRRARRVYTACAVVEVTLAFALLAGSLTSLGSLRMLQSVSPGFEVRQRTAAGIALPASGYPEPIDRRRFYDALLARLRTLPVHDAALVSRLPAGGAAEIRTFEFRDAASDRTETRSALYYTCSPRFFETFGILVAGQSFARLHPSEAPGAAIVSAELAERFWKTQDAAIGNRIRLDGREYSIVGVAGETRHFGLNRGNTPAVYVPFGDDVPLRMDLAISSPLGAAALAPLVQQAILDLDPDIPLFDMRPLATFVEESITVQRVVAMLLPFFSASALMMAFVGLYGVISYSVAQRTREIAIRRAFGATGRDVAGTVFMHTLRVAGTGVLLGAALSFVLIRLMVGFFYGVTAVSPMLLGAVAAAMLALSAVAASVPGRRAVRIEPVTMLRQE